MRILVLDDIKYRHDIYDKIYSDDEVVHSYTYHDFINHLNNGPWDLVHLDHDLGEFVDNADCYTDGWGKVREYNGTHASYAISDMDDSKLPKRIIIHSINSIGARRMVDILQRRGIPTTWEPFASNPMYDNNGDPIDVWLMGM